MKRFFHSRLFTLFLLPALLYLAAFYLLTYPWMTHFFTHFFMDAGDGPQNVWNIWWIDQAVTRLHVNPWFTPLLHAPTGTSLLGQTLNPFNGFMGLILLRFLSLTQTYNFLVVFSFVMGGLTTFWLARKVSHSYWPSLVAGAVFTFSQYHTAHAHGHMQLVSLEWIPLFLLAWLVFLEGPSWKRGLSAGLALFLVILCDYYYFFYCVLSGVGMALWMSVDKKDWLYLVRRQALPGMAVFISVALATCGVLALALARLDSLNPLRGAHSVNEFSLDLLAAFIPGGQWRFAELAQGYWSRLPGNTIESSVYLGWVVIGLMVFVWLNWKKTAARFSTVGLWTGMLAFFWLMAFGPDLLAGGQVIWQKWMPYSLLELVFPPLQLSGCPVRMMVMVTLSGGLMTAFGLQMLFEKMNGKKAVLAVIMAAVFGVEIWPNTLPMTSFEIPEYLRVLQQQPRDGSLFDRATPQSISLYYQTEHGFALTDGYISRYPKNVWGDLKKKNNAFDRGDYLMLLHDYGTRYLAVSEPLEETSCQAHVVEISAEPNAHLYRIEADPFEYELFDTAGLHEDGLQGKVEYFENGRITGWAVLDGVDAANSDIWVVLTGADSSWRMPVCRQNRNDVVKDLGDDGLYLKSGYTAYLDLAELPVGEYAVSILVQNGDVQVMQSTGLVYVRE